VLTTARSEARTADCVSRLHQIGLAVHLYTRSYGEGRFVPVTGADLATPHESDYRIWRDGAAHGLGLLVSKNVTDRPDVLFCPEADRFSIGGEYGWSNWGSAAAGDFVASSYLYRGTSAGGDVLQDVMERKIIVMCHNRVGAADQNTCHQGAKANYLLGDGSVGTFETKINTLTFGLDATTYAEVWTNADALR
jgi:prepilin-type processing-associated H-X9-DG protein